MSESRRRLAAWWRWMLQPWRSVGLISALVASFAVPAFMAASADAFLESASDSIVRQVSDDRPGGLDASVLAVGELEADAVASLDVQIRGQLDGVDGLAVQRRTVYVGLPGLALQSPSEDDGVAAETIVGSGARFLADDRAVAALEVVDGDPTVEGIWISQRLSDRLALPAGSFIAVNDSDPVIVAGVFANLWEDGERDTYWDELPAAVVPTYAKAFSGPSFEVVVVPESLIYTLGVEGTVRWDAAAAAPPRSHDELVAYAGQLRDVERSFTASTGMVGAISGFAGAGGRVPDLVTDTFDIRTEADGIIAELDQPIATTAVGGIVLGLVVTVTGAVFAVRKREIEMRLLRADGDASWRFSARALMQYLPPAALGALIGAVAGLVLVGPAGESGFDGGVSINLVPIVITAAIGLAIAALVTGFAASNVLTTRSSGLGALRASWLLPVLGIAAAAWIQVGSDGAAGEVDALLIVFPLAGLVAGVGMVVLAVRWLMHRVRRTGGSLPPALFLAWRRITASESGAVLLAGAMGIGLGLIVFATSLSGSLTTATDAKVTAVVGGRTRVEAVRAFDATLPETTTLIRVQSSRLTIGDDLVSVVAIDPATYADGVSWDQRFGGSAAEIVEVLETPVDADLAAIAVGGRSMPSDGGLGGSGVVSYEVVGTVAGAPLASDVHATLIVSADQLTAAARRIHDADRPPDVDPDEWTDLFRAPLDRARHFVVSQLDEPTMTAFFATSGIGVREAITKSGQESLVGTRAATWTFDYLEVLAVIAGLAAAGTLLFHLSEQHSRRQLSVVMAERMGLRPSTAALAAVMEVAGLVAIALAAGIGTGLVLASRVFDRFEPDPRLPPDVGLQPNWSLLGGLALAAALLVTVASLVNLRLANRRSFGEVLRDG